MSARPSSTITARSRWLAPVAACRSGR
jgi:hypothetical protein